MARSILIAWSYFAAGVSLAVGAWAAIAPCGSVWAGLGLALTGVGLGIGITLYVQEETAPRRHFQAGRQRSASAVAGPPSQVSTPPVATPSAARRSKTSPSRMKPAPTRVESARPTPVSAAAV